MATNEIKALLKAKKFEKALIKLDGVLQHQKECPYLWNLRGDIIQVLDTQDGPPLAEAVKSYKKALRLDSANLESLESLAHFYDAVDPKPATAKRYAETYIAIAKRRLSEMKRIVNDG